MNEINSKSSLAVALSKLKGFETPKVRLEQYHTPSELAAQILWTAHIKGELQGSMADFGCGNGIFGLGALLLGCAEVVFIESESQVMQICKENYAQLLKEYGKAGLPGKVRFLEQDIEKFTEKVDIVLQNPPFGTKAKHQDMIFLENAMQCAKKIYSIHKATTKAYVDRFIDEHGFALLEYYEIEFPIKASFSFHTKQRKHILAGVWSIAKKSQF